ncbi:MAG: hypothetical protein ABL900_06295 [Burkholderiaceae bacterium]
MKNRVAPNLVCARSIAQRVSEVNCSPVERRDVERRLSPRPLKSNRNVAIPSSANRLANFTFSRCGPIRGITPAFVSKAIVPENPGLDRPGNVNVPTKWLSAPKMSVCSFMAIRFEGLPTGHSVFLGARWPSRAPRSTSSSQRI